MKPYELNTTGVCSTCHKTTEDKIKCTHCEAYYHATCSQSDPICRATFLKVFHTSTVKPNFMWSCDHCLTLSEQNKVATLSQQVAALTATIDKLVQAQGKDSQSVKSQVTEEFTLLTELLTSDIKTRFQEVTTDLTDKFENLKSELTESTQMPAKVDATPATANPWNNPQKVQQVKAALLVKPTADGQPLDIQKVQDAAIEHGIPLDSVVVSATGETFVNLPNEDTRRKLQPILANMNPEKEIVVLKSKLPSIALLSVTKEHKTEDITRMIKQQNEAIGTLMDSGCHLSVVYTKKPTADQKFHQVVLRVSPEIRRAIKANNHKIHMASNVHRVVDRFHVKRCNTCHCFGHYADKCNNTKVCGYCSETNHFSRDCPLKNAEPGNYTCNNCKKHDPDTAKGHSTFWSKCPAYLEQQKRHKRTIGYNYDDLN